jgi:hypothetical protein
LFVGIVLSSATAMGVASPEFEHTMARTAAAKVCLGVYLVHIYSAPVGVLVILT